MMACLPADQDNEKCAEGWRVVGAGFRFVQEEGMVGGGCRWICRDDALRPGEEA